MKFSMSVVFALCAFLFSISLYAQETVVDKATQAVFPRDISFNYSEEKYQLQITGVTTRKKLIIKVYSLAHYLQKGVEQSNMNKIQTIMSDNYAKQFTMKWIRDVEAEKVKEGFQQSFHKVFSDQEYGLLQNEINKFIQFFNKDAHKGEEYVLRWLPGGYIKVLIDDKEIGSLTNKQLAIGLWNIWFGENSIVNRNDLISLMP